MHEAVATPGGYSATYIEHVWLNHDHDLVDVGLVGSGGTERTSAVSTTASATSSSGTAPTASASTNTPTRLSHMLRGVVALGAVALAVTLGSVAPAQATSSTAVSTAGTPTETMHTTENHPWLTADRGWVEAGNLKPGEPVVTLNGSNTETVAWVRVVAGQADMYNLTVAQDHTYAVGDGRAVVHNECVDDPGDPEGASKDLAQQRADQGLPPAGTPAGENDVFARLDINGKSYYGQNGKVQPITLRVNAISRYHAETNAFQAAFNDGVRGGDAILYVDKPLCPPCQGAVPNLGGQLGLNSLTIYDPFGLYATIEYTYPGP